MSAKKQQAFPNTKKTPTTQIRTYCNFLKINALKNLNKKEKSLSKFIEKDY